MPDTIDGFGLGKREKMGRKSRKSKASGPESNSPSIKRELVLVALGCLATLAITKGWDHISLLITEDDVIDQKVDNLYTAITMKHGSSKDKLQNLNASRLEKIKVIKEIQKRIHSRSFQSLEKIVPTLVQNSDKYDWNKAINAHTQLEKQEHKDFQVAEATACWQASLNLAMQASTNPMAKTRLYSEKNILELVAADPEFKIDIEVISDKMIEGVTVSKDKVRYIPASYPVIVSENSKTVFIPSLKSLDSINYFNDDRALKSEDPNEHKLKNRNH